MTQHDGGMDSGEVITFLKDQILGWVGTLMRDLDAQGYAVSLEEVGVALEVVLEEIAEMDLGTTNEDFEEFLRNLNDGRGNE